MDQLADFVHQCSLWSDEYLLEEMDKGPGAYASPEFFRALQAEAGRRGLRSETVPTSSPESPASVAKPSGGEYLRALWQGRIDLPYTFWLWGVGGNLALFASAEAVPKHLVLGAVFISYAYFVFVGIAILRSARRYEGSKTFADLAQVLVVLLMAGLVFQVLRAFLRFP